VLYHYCGYRNPIAIVVWRDGQSSEHAGYVDSTAASIAGIPAGTGFDGRKQLAPPVCQRPPVKGGLLSPIPYETTKAQAETGGISTASMMFDLSGPTGGKPRETLIAWILTLPRDQSFARDRQFHIPSRSRKDLAQDVSYNPTLDLIRLSGAPLRSRRL
jgi:hypothetical protein